MFATALIVFRETLEAALVISIVLASCRGASGSRLWASVGVGGGLLGAALVAVFAEAITSALSGMGQEVLNASILFLAVAMLGWHSIWMSAHARELTAHVRAAGAAVADGSRPLYAIAIVVGAAVLREGAETVLFLMGVGSDGDSTVAMMILAGLGGAAVAALIGAVLYKGLLRIPLHRLFAVTNALIVLLMAGMAAQGAGFLVQANLLPPFVEPLWDTSGWLTETSVAGKMLHALIGYQARPAGIQVLFYLGVLVGVLGLSHLVQRQMRGTMRPAIAAAAFLAFAAATVLAPVPARAEFKILSPNVDFHEVEIEHNFSTTFDKRPDNNNRSSMTQEIGVGILPFWSIELEGEFGKEPGERWNFNATTIENTFMLTEPGKYWMDAAIFAEFSHARSRDEASTIKFGGLLQKEHDKFVHTLNVFLEKEVGPNAGTADTLQYAWQTRYRFHPLFQPGIELYGEIADLNNAGKFNETQFRIGPVVAGSLPMGQILGRGKLKYEVGYLFGTTTATEQGTLRTRLELEIPF